MLSAGGNAHLGESTASGSAEHNTPKEMNRMKRRGFTLIELLVVIAII